MQVQQPPTQQVEGGPPPASGRASYRGGAREPRPGAAGGEGYRAPVEEMRAMAIGTGEAQGRTRRDRFVEPHTRPAHIADKRGMVIIEKKENERKVELNCSFLKQT